MDGGDGMSGGMGSGMSGSDSGLQPLSTSGVDFQNATQAADFLADLLNDDELKVIGNAYASYFWYGVAAFIATSALFNALRRCTLYCRLRQAARKQSRPARPHALLTRWLATVTAAGREISYAQFTPARLPWLKVPPMGTLILVVAYLAFVLALEFTNNTILGAQRWQALGVRAGWLAVAQTPLLILLINKYNWIGLLTGLSYERFNVLHHWAARIMLLLAIFHFGFQSYGWQKYGLMQLEWDTDTCPPTGIAAFAILLWMNISTLVPVRRLSYEFFVLQHIISFFGLIVAIMMHLPSTALHSRVYIYIPIGLYLLDRVIRTVILAIKNLRISRATMTQMEGEATRIVVANKSIGHWRPGAHVLISIPRFGFFQSHPATIAATPTSHNGDLVFILKCCRGFTKRIMNGADNSRTNLLPQNNKEVEASITVGMNKHFAILDGPYGGSQADFAAFDSVCLIAGSTGVTFTLALLLYLGDLAALGGEKLVVRRVHFVWCVKNTHWATWANQEISAACAKLDSAGIDVAVSVYVTCDETFTQDDGGAKKACCDCDTSDGRPCCCANLDSDTDDDDDLAVTPADSLPATKSALVGEKTSLLPAPQRKRLPLLPGAWFYSGRPQIRDVLTDLLEQADGESGVAVCGPIGLNAAVRNSVVRLSDERAIHKGTGAQGCYLHVESFS